MPKAIQCNNTNRNIVLFSQTGFPEQETCNITATCLQDIIVVKNSREEPSFSKKPGAAGCDSEHLLSEPGSSENVRPTNGFFGRMWHPAFQRAVGIVAGLVLTATVGRKIYSTYGNVNPSTENRSVEKNDSLSFAVHQIVQGNNAYSMQRLNAIQQDSDKNAVLNASENSLTNHSSVTREFKITLHEYLKEIEVIGKLAPLHLDDFYNKVFNVDMKIRVQRSHNDLKEKKISVSEEINFFLNDPMIDWRIRNELHLLYSKANETVEVSNAKNGQVRDAKLILACIDLTLHYLHENRKNGLSGVSFIYGVFFIDKLLLILDEVKLARKGGEGKRLRQDVKLYISDIYSNKNVDMPYDVMDMYKHTITHGQVLHKNRNDYFYSAIREHVLKGENVTAQKPEKDEVKIIDLTFCQKERENPTLSDTLRLIAKAIKHPLSTLAEEGRILYDYNVKEEGCATDMHIVELTKKIDESIDLLMEWVPHYNRGRMILSMAATSMDMIADAIDGNELSVSSVSEIYGYFISFTKDLLSSLSAKQINDMESKNLEDEILKMTRKIKHTNNRLTIETSDPDEITFIDREYGNFVDEMSKKVIYYNDDNAWHISPDVRFTPETKKILENTYGIYQQGYDIYLIKNSSPDLYADGTLARIDDILHVFVDNEMYSVSETLISDGVYRYVANKDDVFTPVVNIGGVWEFESKHSPYVGEDLIDFLVNNERIREKLVSEDTLHENVTPIRPSVLYQYDGKHNKYIKIDDNYYLFKTNDFSSSYIEGCHDILPVNFDAGKYHVHFDLLGNMYDVYKIALRQPLEQDDVGKYYLDSSVINKISKRRFLNTANGIFSFQKSFSQYMSKSNNIDGAVTINRVDYIIFDKNFIEISNNGDDTYLLGRDDNIKIYKNSKSNTYFIMPKKVNEIFKAQQLKIRDSRCIAKRQVLSLCTARFMESKDITTLLRRNSDHSINIDAPVEHLEPYGDADGFFKEKEASYSLYFLSNDGVFFHAKEEPISDGMVPVFFKIYGKKNEGEIDKNIIIADVCIIKDFDTKQTIITTPSEALEMVFNLDAEVSSALSKWQNSDIKREPFETSFTSLDNLKKKLLDNGDVQHVKDFFSLSSKKLVTSIKYSNEFIDDYKIDVLENKDDYSFNSITSIADSPSHAYLFEVFNDAFDKTKKDISKVRMLIEKQSPEVKDYVENRLRISDFSAQKLFIDTLLIKLNRMDLVFDENDKSNIFLVMNKHEKKQTMDNGDLSRKNNVAGFSYSNDPLDRIFIMTDFIHAKEYGSLPPHIKSQKLSKDTKAVSATMCHESIHALGRPEDYFYHYSDGNGDFGTIEETLARTELYIRGNVQIRGEFLHMCKLYFMSNPVYSSYDLDSLIKPESLSLLFQYDDFLRGVILINNPDTISVLVNDIAKFA